MTIAERMSPSVTESPRQLGTLDDLLYADVATKTDTGSVDTRASDNNVDDQNDYAALVTLENIDFETLTLSMNLSFIALIERSRKRQKAEGGFSVDEMRQRLGL